MEKIKEMFSESQTNAVPFAFCLFRVLAGGKPLLNINYYSIFSLI